MSNIDVDKLIGAADGHDIGVGRLVVGHADGVHASGLRSIVAAIALSRRKEVNILIYLYKNETIR
jgi:hypothetical protein